MIVFSGNPLFLEERSLAAATVFFVTVLQKQKVYTAMSPFSQFLTEQFQALSEVRRVCILAKRFVSASLFCLSKTLDLFFSFILRVFI